MLVIARKVGEKIKVGENVTMTITSIDRSRGVVRIAFDAPKEVPIQRIKLPPNK
jgi:carbon storage regulator